MIAKPKPVKCRHCGKIRGVHKAGTLNCPAGTRHRVMDYTWHAETTWEPKQSK